MSYNGSGTFQINTTGQPVVAGTVISSTAFNALTADLATGLSTAITKDGQTTTTARIPFAQGISSTLTTDSSSISTGSIITAGGAGIAKNLYVGANANVAGTLGVTGVATFSAAPIYSSLTASSAVATDASKALVSVTNTGTGNNVLATSPTLVTPILGTPQSGSLVNCTDLNYTGFKNRIINSAMVIDQRNAGASVTPTADNTYTLDRWKTRNGGGAGRFSVIQSSTSAANFSTSVLLTVTTTSAPSGAEVYGFEQDVEGYNMADFGWGTANAQPVSVSFQVRSSLTGTYCISIRNSAADRSYVAEFTINAANTFETKTITIPAITTGTWLSTNGAGLLFLVCLGSGSTREGTAGSWQSSNIVATSNQVDWINTSGATFYITGVQLEKGSTATSFDYRPYGTELALCQRYFYKIVGDLNPFAGLGSGVVTGLTTARVYIKYPVNARTSPTISFGGVVYVYDGGNATVTSVAINAGDQSCSVDFTCSGGGITIGRGCVANTANASTDFLQFSAEL